MLRIKCWTQKHIDSESVITAGLSLDTLENCVKGCFSTMPNDPLPHDYFAEFTAADLLDISGSRHDYVVNSITDDLKIEIIWKIPSMYLLHRSKPLQYISWLICHNGEGSLISYLRKQRWCLNISSDIENVLYNCTKEYAQYSLSLFLTRLGSFHKGPIVNSIYSYISLFRKGGPQKLIYDEISKVQEAKFR